MTPATARTLSNALCDTAPPGADVFIIANADTVMTRSRASLMAEVYPDVPLTQELGEQETLLSIDKASRLLGYEPRHAWRDHVD